MMGRTEAIDEAHAFLQLEHPFTSDAVMELQVLAELAENDHKAKKALDAICEDIAVALSEARERVE